MAVVYNWSTTYPGSVDATSASGSMQAVVDGVHVVMASHVNSLATAITTLQGENQDLKAIALNLPVEGQVTGTVPTYVGTVFLRAGTAPTIRTLIGCVDPDHAATLEMRRFTGGTTVSTLGGVDGQPAEQAESNVAISADDWYEFYLYTDDEDGVGFCNGIVVELPQ